MRTAAEHGLKEDDVQREAQMLGKINHPKIVHYFGCQFVGSKKDPRKHFWIIMELVHGATLYTHVRNENEASKILKWAGQIAAGLAYLHLELRMLHRDIKSQNIMVSLDDSIRLIDLGLAVVVRSSGASSKVGEQQPMLARRSSETVVRYGPPDDMWGMGCVLGELATLQPLVSPMWMPELQEDRLRVRRASEVLSPKLGEVVRGLLDLRPGFRLTAKQSLALALEDKKKEEEAAEIEFEAALRVQAVMRGHWGRQLMRFRRRRNFLAAKLQSAYRGHIARLDVMVLRRFNAANKLQGERERMDQEEKAGKERAKASAWHHLFDLTSLAVKLGKPDGVHHVLSEVCDCAQSASAPVAQEQGVGLAQELLQVHHFLGRHLPVLKAPPMDVWQTLIQLASQEPAASHVRRAAEAALHKAHEGSRRLIEWTNKWQLPCVMDIREHSGAVFAVTVSPDGKLIASGSEDKTVVVVEAATGRVRCRLRGHGCDACCVRVAYTWRDFSARLRRCCAGSAWTWSLAADQCLPAAMRPVLLCDRCQSNGRSKMTPQGRGRN